MKRNIKSLAMTMALATSLSFASPNNGNSNPNPSQDALEAKVRHELLMLPYFGIFDNLQFRVEDGKVTLLGQAMRPTLRSDAGNVVKRIEGVTEVKNEIEVLPLSRFDDQIRLSVARNVYGQVALNRYALGSQPSIHIVVKNGNVTLEGVVASRMDSQIANMQANATGGVFSVTNNLRTER